MILAACGRIAVLVNACLIHSALLVLTYIEANSDNDNPVLIVPMNATVPSLARSADCQITLAVPINPYTSETGPPAIKPVAIVLHKASQVAISDTHVANIDTTEKFF